jgi:hypothetical protein
MPNVNERAGEGASDGLSARRREALWKWRWLGFRDSTPAFKASLVLLAAMLLALIAYATVIGR